jgi:hypothetical protein
MGERRSVEFADAPGGKPHAREASERVDGRVEASRRALERATVEDVRSETSSRGESAAGRAVRSSASDTRTRSSERSDGEYTYTPTSTSERSTAFSESDPPWSDVGPGAPFPETFEAREARLLGTLNAAMTTTMRYWDREEEMAHVEPVPVVAADSSLDASLAARHATADAWAAPSDDDASVGADAGGSLSGDSGDRVFHELGDFESAHDLATPWNDRPKVIARRIVRHIVNRALREKFPPKPSFAAACFGCAAPPDGDARDRRRRARRR